MTNKEFLELSDEAQLTWLTEQTDIEREIEDICCELRITRADLQGYGYTWALGSWRFLSMKDRGTVVAQN